MDKYDIVIVGAGPAGSTFARIAEPSKAILLLDGNRDGKPCGGVLAPDAQKALARFDLTLPKEILVDPQIFSVKTIDLKTKRQRWYQRMYINVDRKKFDEWLISLIPENVRLEKGLCTKIEKSGDGFIVSYKPLSGQAVSVFAKTVVGADGANSIVRKSFFKEIKTRKYIAIQQWFEEKREDLNPFYSCIFDPQTSDCYSWSISKDHYIIFGGAFALKNCRKNFEKQKSKLPDFGFHLGEPIRTEACLVLRPKSAGSFCCGNDNIFLIGEAAGFISPSSLEGISTAINSAILLDKSMRCGDADQNRAYKRNTVPLRLKILAKNIKCPFMYNPFLRNLVLRSGFSSIDMYDGQHHRQAQ